MSGGRGSTALCGRLLPGACTSCPAGPIMTWKAGTTGSTVLDDLTCICTCWCRSYKLDKPTRIQNKAARTTQSKIDTLWTRDGSSTLAMYLSTSTSTFIPFCQVQVQVQVLCENVKSKYKYFVKMSSTSTQVHCEKFKYKYKYFVKFSSTSTQVLCANFTFFADFYHKNTQANCK